MGESSSPSNSLHTTKDRYIFKYIHIYICSFINLYEKVSAVHQSTEKCKCDDSTGKYHREDMASLTFKCQLLRMKNHIKYRHLNFYVMPKLTNHPRQIYEFINTYECARLLTRTRYKRSNNCVNVRGDIHEQTIALAYVNSN